MGGRSVIDGEQRSFTGPSLLKPVYGREGLRESEQTLEASSEHLYDDQLMVEQQSVQFPTATLQTEEGRYEMHLVHNCFVVNGMASAIGVRIPPTHL